MLRGKLASYGPQLAGNGGGGIDGSGGGSASRGGGSARASASGGGGWRRWSVETMAVVRAVVDLVAQVMVEMAV